MQYIGYLVIAALVFGVCFLVDKGFTRLFRSRKQHKSGRSVRLSKKNGAFGLVLAAIGVAALLSGTENKRFMVIGGCVFILLGIFLIVRYMTFGIYYDDRGFLLSVFGKKSKEYEYRDIQSQQLYNSYGSIVIMLYLTDEKTVQLQANMDGVYPFLDYAFEAWLKQTGRSRDECAFYDPANSRWFPSTED